MYCHQIVRLASYTGNELTRLAFGCSGRQLQQDGGMFAEFQAAERIIPQQAIQKSAASNAVLLLDQSDAFTILQGMLCHHNTLKEPKHSLLSRLTQTLSAAAKYFESADIASNHFCMCILEHTGWLHTGKS